MAFWKRRIFRLYPPYLLALALFLALQLPTRPLDSWFALDVGLHLIMAHNLVGTSTYSINLAFWTLALGGNNSTYSTSCSSSCVAVSGGR